MTDEMRQKRRTNRNNIYARYHELGLTQATLGNRMDLAQSTVARISSGDICPTIRLAAKFAVALECTVEDLWPGLFSAARREQRVELPGDPKIRVVAGGRS